MPNGGTKTPLDVGTLTARLSGAFQPSAGVFSPGLPLVPANPQPVRAVDFPVGWNTTITPRSYEAFGFPHLRAFANVELVRLAIETRKDQIGRLEWRIKPRKDFSGRGRPHDASARIAKVTKFFRKPDGANRFDSWLRMLLEDLLAIDAPAIEKRRNRAGELIALDVVMGDTIKVLVDDSGRRPLAPAPSYEQVIKGVPWALLSTDDLIYAPRNVRSNHLYGFSPVEQIIVTLHTILQRQTAQLSYFTEGNLPAGLINAPEGWTPDQIKEMQAWMDGRLAGNAAERSKLMWGPANAKYQAFKDSPLKDDFDEWLARVVCYAFSLPPTPFIKQMNRATADNDSSRALEEGLEPLALWSKRLLDEIIQDDLGQADLEFAWNDEREIDPVKQAQIDDTNLKNGSANVNEVRAARGLDPVDGGDRNLIYTATGGVLLANAGVPVEPCDGGSDGNAAVGDADELKDDDQA